jgi:DNA invertase Pin-like site-specific DNA recombinase
MEELKHQGVGLYLHQQNVDSSTAAGKAMLTMCGVFAEFERSIIVERINAGLARARAQGKELGRPRVDGKTEREIRKMLAKGTGKLKIARTLGVGVSTVQRVAAA